MNTIFLKYYFRHLYALTLYHLGHPMKAWHLYFLIYILGCVAPCYYVGSFVADSGMDTNLFIYPVFASDISDFLL